MIKGIIFDIDGVVLDSMKIWQDLGIRFLEQQGRKAKPDLEERLSTMSMEEGAEYLRTEYALDSDSRQIIEGLNKIIEGFYFYEAEAKPGMVSLIKKFYKAGIPMAAATASPNYLISAALERNGVLEYLKGVYTTEDAGESKRSPRLYRMVSGIIGSAEEETLVFEDALFCLETASSAGFRTVGVSDAYGGENQAEIEKACDYYIADTAVADADKILKAFC